MPALTLRIRLVPSGVSGCSFGQGSNALIISDDLFNLYVTLELIGLSAAGMTALSGSAEAVRAALRYLLMGLIGSLFYLLGVALVYGLYGSLTTDHLSTITGEEPAGIYALILMTIGLLVKAAVFPGHVWLPPAHTNAPAPVSALLSALVVKGGLIILIRLWTDVFASSVTTAALYGLSSLGACAILWGALHAIVQKRLKMLIAYSTVAQLGYLVLATPLLSQPHGQTGMLFMLAAHALAKTAFFLAAGNVLFAASHDRIDELGTVIPRLPLTTFAIALAGVSLIGLPPSGGFTGKWLLLGVAIDKGLWPIAIVLAAGGFSQPSTSFASLL